MTDLTSILQRGDCILYSPSSLYGKLIAVKTWHNCSHVELYVGNGQSCASRDGVGVGQYPLRTDHVAYVLRPDGTEQADWPKFWAWFRTVNGQKYDWWGLLRFIFTHEIGHNPNKQFCSEFVVRAYRAMGIDAVSPAEDADAVSPGMLLASPHLMPVATANSLK